MTVFSRSKSKQLAIRPMTQDDIEDVRAVSQIAWTDLATRDAGRKVRYPKRPAKLIEAYMWKEPLGCLVVESDRKVIGSAFCHVWGKVGWTGPLEILPNFQDMGIGKALLAQCERFLDSRDCRIIGLETMPHLTKNLHFYLSSGYAAGDLTVIVEKALDSDSYNYKSDPQEINESNLPDVLAEIPSLSSKINPFLDYSREWEMVIRKGLGVGLVHRSGNELDGAALLHTYQRFEDGDYASIKMLVTDPGSTEAPRILSDLLDRAESLCYRLGKSRVMTRFSVDSTALYNTMSKRGYMLKGSNVRMIKRGEYHEKGMLNLSSWAG